MASPTAAVAALSAAGAARGRCNAISLVFRQVVQSRLEALYRRGERVLDVGCGGGEDALFLASRGVRVVGIDPSMAMVETARQGAADRGLGPEECRFERLAVEDLRGAEWTGAFDGAYSAFGALNRADLRAAGAVLAAGLRPGAPVLVSLRGPSPLPAAVRRALTGLGARRREPRPRGADVPGAVAYPTPAEARRALGPSFVWTDAYALGVLVPSPEHESWAADHPQAFGAVAALERAVRRWPGLRGRGDYVVLEGRRAGGTMTIAPHVASL